MADIFSFIFDLIELSLHLVSRLVYVMGTLLKVNFNLISAFIETSTRILGGVMHFSREVLFAFVDVLEYVAEGTGRFAYFVGSLYTGTTTAIEAIYTVSQMLVYAAYITGKYLVTAGTHLAVWTSETAVVVFQMVADCTPLLFSKVVDLCEDGRDKSVEMAGRLTTHIRTVFDASALYMDHGVTAARSLAMEAVEISIYPMLFCRDLFVALIQGILSYSFYIAMVTAFVLFSTAFMLSFRYLKIVALSFVGFVYSATVIVSPLLLRNLAYHFSNFAQFVHLHRSRNQNDAHVDEDRDISDHEESDNQSEDGHDFANRRDFVWQDQLYDHYPGGDRLWATLETRRDNHNTYRFEDSEEEDVPGPSGHGRNSPRQTPKTPVNPDKDVTILKRELEEERDKRLCVVCQDNEKNVLVLPCKHMCMCEDCADEIIHDHYLDRRLCPLCRTRINKVIDVFL